VSVDGRRVFAGPVTIPAAPGSGDVRLLFLSLVNKTSQPVTLDSLSVTNASAGAGDPDDLDHTFSGIRIYKDDGDGRYSGEDVIGTADLSQVMTPEQLFIFALIMATYMPCLSALAVLSREFGWKDALKITLASVTIAFMLGGLANALFQIF